ncbi:MAG: hypothetical protein EOP38_09675 [Rubrivivax sp.]|nr:MAG: hypothetical protein EOP38_09675 [Rubrivivax sp.]
MMTTLSSQALPAQAGALFEQSLLSGFAALAVPPNATGTRIKQTSLPTFPHPLETFELRADFPGATVLTTFGQSAVDPTLFFSEMALHNPRQPTLFLRDYLASRHDFRLDSLRFQTTAMSLEQGIDQIAKVWLSLLDLELCPVLEGRAWYTAPFDWGDHK